MIQRTPSCIEARNTCSEPKLVPVTPAEPSWQEILSRSITTPSQLLSRLGLSVDDWKAGADAGHALFPIRVPEPYLDRIEYGNPHDPLLRQVLPIDSEAQAAPGFVSDPLQEDAAIAAPGLIRKYKSRALLMVTGQCAINCRYCFRRHFPYQEHRLGREDREKVVDTLMASPEINEIILSGGDPLAANDRLLAQWASLLDSVPHLRRLRIHSRLPVVIPGRVCSELTDWLSASRLQKVLVVHINHAAEIDSATRTAMARLAKAGVTLLNQSVILRGVNDNTTALCNLSEALFDAGIMPYYLHAFDPVTGAHHFDVSDQRATELVREMQGQLPGFLVPKLVRELPGQASKTTLDLGRR